MTRVVSVTGPEQLRRLLRKFAGQVTLVLSDSAEAPADELVLQMWHEAVIQVPDDDATALEASGVLQHIAVWVVAPDFPDSEAWVCPWVKALPRFKRGKLALVVAGNDGNTTAPALEACPPELQVLRILDATMTRLPTSLGNLRNLRTLDLHGCRSLGSLPLAIGHLTALTTLDLNSCRSLRRLPESIDQLTALTVLRVDECDWSSFPSCMKGMRVPSQLRLFLAESLPDLSPLTALRSLTVFKCSMSQLPPGMCDLALQRLCLQECHSLRLLPNNLARLTMLTGLTVTGCSALTSLPEACAQLTSLSTLRLSDNPALQLQPDLLGRMPRLTSLALCNGGDLLLQCLPQVLAQVRWLTMLDLTGTAGLRALPDAIGGLTSLCSLRLDECAALTALPEAIGSLSALKTLRCRGCPELRSFPRSMSNLVNLTSMQPEPAVGQWPQPVLAANHAFLLALRPGLFVLVMAGRRRAQHRLPTELWFLLDTFLWHAQLDRWPVS